MRNPNSVPFICADCLVKTRVNVLTGHLYSHQVPGSLATCSSSGDLVQPPTGGEKFEVPPLRYEPAAPSVYRNHENDGSTSVKTVSAGLPGKGRRR